MRRAVGVIMAAVAIFSGVAQGQAVASGDPESSVWGWIPVVVFAGLAVLNLKPSRKIRRGPTPPEAP